MNYQTLIPDLKLLALSKIVYIDTMIDVSKQFD